MNKKIISIFFAFLLVVFLVYAATYYKVNNGTTVTINEHGVCNKVTNSAGAAIFIPTATAAQWSAFRTHKPAGVTLNSCAPTFTGGGTCSSPVQKMTGDSTTLKFYTGSTSTTPCATITLSGGTFSYSTSGYYSSSTGSTFTITYNIIMMRASSSVLYFYTDYANVGISVSGHSFANLNYNSGEDYLRGTITTSGNRILIPWSIDGTRTATLN